MIEKEKQIEEMYNDFLKYKFTTPIDKFSYKGAFEYFIEQGYRKITENDIVLSRSEHQHYLAYKLIEPQIKGCLDRERELERRIQELEAGQKSLISREKAQSVECNTIFALKKQAKKELKAFAEEIKTAFYLEFDELIPSIMADKIDKIAEKYGIEIGETK